MAAAVAATAMPVETSDNCYTAAPAYIGSAPDGLLVPSDLRVECAAAWCALAIVAAAVWQPPNMTSVGAALIAWALASAALSAIANVDCGDDETGAGFWIAHMVVSAAPWVIVTRT